MRKMTWVVATMMLSLTGCQTCSNWTRQLTGSVQGCFGRLGNCSLGNCRMGGANNVGAPCDAGCESAQAPMSAMGGGACPPCAESSSNYGSYDGVVIGSYDGIPTGATISTPSSSIPSSGISSGSYIGNPTPAGIRGETIMPKPAN